MAKYPYNTARWRGLRKRKLIDEPLCRYCKQQGRITRATVVDHIKPHRGDESLIWDWGNLQSLCKPCHDSAAKMKDIHGVVPGVGVDGLPLDDQHPWVKGE